jgi:hypothetical protein
LALGRYVAPDFSGSVSGSLAARSALNQIDTLKTYFETFLTYFAAWALTVAIGNVILDTPITFGEAYHEVRRRFGAVLGLIGLQTLIGVGFFSPLILIVMVSLFGGPGGSSSLIIGAAGCLSIFTLIYSIIQVRLQVILPAAVNEELSPRQALTRSWELTRNYWWRTFALSLVISILRSIVALGPGALLTALVGMAFKLDFYADLAIAQGVGIFTTTLYIPVEIGAIALYYYDQRVRKEGFDLDTAIAQRYESGEEMDGMMETVPARNVRQDHDLYPLLASGQHDQAMQTFSRRLDKIPHRKARVVSASPAKRKVPHFPKPIADQETEQ